MSVDNKKIKLNYTIINTQNDFLQEVLQESQNDYNEVNSHGETLLMGLKNKCSDESISTLLNRCCNINIANEAGETALHFAVQRDTINVAYILIKMGADVNLKNKNGYTPLHIAAKYGGITILQEILRFQHLKKDERNHLGETALYLSLSVNRPDDIVSALIDAGCNVNFPDYRKKQTPLHLAVLRQFPSIAYKLIENGSDMNAQDYRDGMTPLHVAIRKCRLERNCISI